MILPLGTSRAQHYPALLQQLIHKSRLLDYFDAFQVDSLPDDEGRAVFFIHSPHASAATLLLHSFSREIGLSVYPHIVERMLKGETVYGIDIAFEEIESNYVALDYIATHYDEHSRLMGLLQRCTSVSQTRMRQNALYISARSETCGRLAMLEGVRFHQDCEISPLVSSFDTVRISVIMLHHNATLLEALLMPNHLESSTYRPGRLKLSAI